MGGGYDPRTCITARELREVWGLPVPELIPDVAWIERAAMRVSLKDVQDGEAGDKNLILNFRVEFHQPFKWLEASFVVGPNPGVSGHDDEG
jgi:hypothetical protein